MSYTYTVDINTWASMKQGDFSHIFVMKEFNEETNIVRFRINCPMPNGSTIHTEYLAEKPEDAMTFSERHLQNPNVRYVTSMKKDVEVRIE